MNKFQVQAIGYVRADEQGFYLELDKAYQDALQGLDGFGYINVLWWAHLADKAEYRAMLTCDQPYKRAPETMGIFATRSPIRPNPIAATPAYVLSIEDNIIRIPYIDAEVDTPILDIKPYSPCLDRIKDAPVPDWCAHWPQFYEESGEFDWAAEFVNAQ